MFGCGGGDVMTMSSEERVEGMEDYGWHHSLAWRLLGGSWELGSGGMRS